MFLALGQAAASDAATANPSDPGRLMSRSIPSGHARAMAESASLPSAASSMSSKPRAASNSAAPARNFWPSSTIRIRLTYLTHSW